MHSWQQKALELWPEFHRAIQEAETPTELWLTLREEFVAISHGKRDDVALSRFYTYAWWSLNDTDETFNTVILDFYEHLPDYERIREEMQHHVSAEQFEAIKNIWRYGRSEEEYVALLRDLEYFRDGQSLADKILPKHAFKGISSRGKPKK